VFVDVEAFGWRDDDDNEGSDGGISPGGRRLDRYGWRNGNVCQYDGGGSGGINGKVWERNGRNNARWEWKSADEEINGGKKGFGTGFLLFEWISSEDIVVPFFVAFSDWSDLIDDIRRNAEWFDSVKWCPLEDLSSFLTGLLESIYKSNLFRRYFEKKNVHLLFILTALANTRLRLIWYTANFFFFSLWFYLDSSTCWL
jgi:hypothetical protein